MFGIKRLKNRIAELKSERDSLLINQYHLCEDYESCESIQIRMHHSIVKSIEKEEWRGDATDPELKGILTTA